MSKKNEIKPQDFYQDMIDLWYKNGIDKAILTDLTFFIDTKDNMIEIYYKCEPLVFYKYSLHKETEIKRVNDKDFDLINVFVSKIKSHERENRNSLWNKTHLKYLLEE